jgi:hypothetical protein
MASGDTVAFCRGGAWANTTGSGVRNANCTASNTCDIRDYIPSWGNANSPRPIIQTGNGKTLFFVGTPGPSHGGYRFWNLDIREGPDFTAGQGIFFFAGDVHDIDMCNLRMDGSYMSINLQPSGAYNTKFSIRNSQFLNTGFGAVYGSPTGSIFESNVFQNNGLISTPQMHTIYFIVLTGGEAPVDSPGEVIFRNNDVRTDTRCGGVMLVIHGQFISTRLTFENNQVSTTSTNPNCYGIQTASSARPGEFHNVVLRRNRITMAGPTALELSCCQDCAATDNVIVGSGVNFNTASTCNGGPPGSRVTAQNNTLFNSSVTIGNQGSGYIVENNAVWTDQVSCFTVAPPTDRFANNYCRAAGGAAVGTIWLGVPNGNFKPLNPGPLVGAANQTYYSPTAIGTVLWSPTDTGIPRAPPIDIGALLR